MGEVKLSDTIIETAAELFSRRGYSGISMREIAEACSVSKPALYYYYDSKDAIARTIVDRLFEIINEKFDRILEAPSKSPYETLYRMVNAYFTLGNENKFLVHFITSQLFGGFEQSLVDYISCRHNDIEARMLQLLTPHVEAGDILNNSINNFTVILLGAMVVMHHAHMHCDVKALTDDLAKSIASDLLYGFSASNPERAANPDIENIHKKTSYLWEKNA